MKDQALHPLIDLSREGKIFLKRRRCRSFVDGIYEALGITHRMVANLSMRSAARCCDD